MRPGDCARAGRRRTSCRIRGRRKIVDPARSESQGVESAEAAAAHGVLAAEARRRRGSQRAGGDTPRTNIARHPGRDPRIAALEEGQASCSRLPSQRARGRRSARQGALAASSVRRHPRGIVLVPADRLEAPAQVGCGTSRAQLNTRALGSVRLGRNDGGSVRRSKLSRSTPGAAPVSGSGRQPAEGHDRPLARQRVPDLLCFDPTRGTTSEPSHDLRASPGHCRRRRRHPFTAS